MNKKKIYKIIVKLVAGLCLVIYMTVSGIISIKTVKASSIPNIKYTCLTSAEYKSPDVQNILSKEMNRTLAIQKMSKIYGADVNLVKEVHRIEKLFGLPKYQFMSQINVESRWANISRMDTNNKLSYGVAQWQLQSAREAYIKITPLLHNMGIEKMVPPTVDLLKNDSNYSIKLAGAYNKYLSLRYPDTNKALCYYNAGEYNNKYESSGYHYSYTDTIQERMVEIASIMGNSY